MIEEAKFALYGLLKPNKVKQKLLQILAYWPAVILIGGAIVTLGWIAALVWLILRALHIV